MRPGKAVVISLCLTKGMRLLRYHVPRKDILIAAIRTTHIPDKGQVIIRYSGTGSRGFCRIFLNIRHNKVVKSILFLAFFEALFQDC